MVLMACAIVPPADAASVAKQCRHACADEIAACVASGSSRLTCRKQIMRRCKQEGPIACLPPRDVPTEGRIGIGTLFPASSLTATATSSSTIHLGWIDTNTREDGYVIERSRVAGSGFATIATVPRDGNRYDDSGLTLGTVYYYRVAAFGRKGSVSAYSNVASVSTLGDTLSPTVPAGLTATVMSCSQVNLSWTAATDSGGAGLRGYKLYRNGLFLKDVLVPATSTSDSALAASTPYSYTISAIDNAGNQSALSSPAGATTPACPDTSPPTVPTGLTVTA